MKFTIGKEPVISVDTKRRSSSVILRIMVRYGPKGQFQEVNVYDFLLYPKAKAIPYGAYDIIKIRFVNVGVSSDTGVCS